jgi:oligoendopeptidase F
MKKRRIAAFLMSLTMMLLIITSCSGSSRRLTRRTIHFDEMIYERPDTDEMLEAIERLTEELKEAEDFNTVLNLIQELGKISENFGTMNTLATIRNNLDMNDEFFDEEARFMGEVGVYIRLGISHFIRELVEGAFSEEYRELVGEHYFEYLLRTLLYQCESVVEYKKELTTLYADYEAMIFESEDSPQLYFEIYARIIELYGLIAGELDFDCAADMIYLLVFNRDYTPADSMKMFENVKNYLVPLIPVLFEHDISPRTYRLDIVMEVMPDVMAEIDKELAEVWDFMVRFGVYDFEASESKAELGFMMEIPAYDTPFIYTYWGDDFYTGVYSILHEFGHFYDHWLRKERGDIYVQDLDASEFYADGMAILMMNNLGAFTRDPVRTQRSLISDMLLYGIIMQSMFEEFQLRAFTMEELTLDALGLLYTDLFIEYGFIDDSVRGFPFHEWLRISHFFYMPFYTMSYVNGFTAAMQLWELSEQDGEAAVAVYLEMIRRNQNQSFTALLESVSLRPPHEPDVLRRIAEQAESFFAN